MQRKKMLWILLTISILWTIYYLFFSIADFRLSEPSQVFDKKDKIIWRIRDTNKRTNWSWPQVKNNRLLTELAPILSSLTFSIYFSENANKVWIENIEFWTEDKLINTFSKIGTLKKVKPHHYNLNNWNLYYYKNKLFITDKELFSSKNNSSIWNKIDLMADANKIYLYHNKVEDVYFGKNGINKYISKNSEFKKLNQINDENLFAKEIPSNIDSYNFFEKKYALQFFQQDENSPLAQILEDGLVFFEWENDSCLLIDYNKSLDPLQFLQSAEKEEISENGIFKSSYLGPFFTNGFYASKLNDKLLIVKDLNKISKIEMIFQTGNTLALNTKSKENIYKNLPRKVNQRKVNKTEKWAYSSFDNSSLKIIDERHILEKNEDKTKLDFSYIDIGFEAENLFTLKNLIFVVGKQKVSLVKNKKILWENEVIPNSSNQSIKSSYLQDFGNNFLLIHYSDFIDALNNEGKRVFRLNLPQNIEGEYSTYYWSGNNYILYFTTDNVFHSVDFNGKIKNFTINNPSKDKFKKAKIIVENGQSIAILIFEKNVIELNLSTSKIISSKSINYTDKFYLKDKNNYTSFELRENGLYYLEKNIINSNYLRSSMQYRFLNSSYLTIQDSKTLYFINEKANIQKIQLESEEIDKYYCLFNNEKLHYVAVLDGIHNKISVINALNKQKIQKQFDSEKTFILLKEGKEILLISSIGKQLVIYPIQE